MTRPGVVRAAVVSSSLILDSDETPDLIHGGQRGNGSDGALHRRFSGLVRHEHNLSVLSRGVSEEYVLLLNNRG